MDAQIDTIYKPADGCPDDWKGGLTVNGDRLEEYLGDESTVFTSIRTAGEHLLHARCLIKDLESSGISSKEMSDTVADELCEAMSHYCRMPALRFFNSLLILKSYFLEATNQRSPQKFSDLPWTDSQYHAMVTYCFLSQMMHMQNPSEEIRGEIIRCMLACIKARPEDASIYVSFGNWLMIHGFTQDAVEHLEKAVELDEEACFGSYYSIANMCQNAVNVQKANRAGPLAKLQARHFLEKGIKNLNRYLELAPKGHWHMHRACISLVLANATIKAKGVSDKVANIEQRNPGFCVESQKMFQRGVESLQLYENCYGQEESDFTFLYEQAADMIATMHREGLLEGNLQKPKGIDYICAYPPCTNSRWKDNQGKDAPTKLCVRCESVSYCSKQCQTKHWKNGHKKECKKLAAARKQRLAANPTPLERPEVDTPQIGD